MKSMISSWGKTATTSFTAMMVTVVPTMNNQNIEKRIADRATRLKKNIIEEGLGRESHIKGCTESEISELKNKYHVVLPASYKVFLKNFGYGLGGVIMKECDILYEDIFSLTDTLRNKILVDEGDPSLPEKAFVFSGRYNEQFFFFNANGLVEEPAIYYYTIDEPNFKKEVDDSVFDIVESEFECSLNIKLYREPRR